MLRTSIVYRRSVCFFSTAWMSWIAIRILSFTWQKWLRCSSKLPLLNYVATAKVSRVSWEKRGGMKSANEWAAAFICGNSSDIAGSVRWPQIDCLSMSAVVKPSNCIQIRGKHRFRNCFESNVLSSGVYKSDRAYFNGVHALRTVCIIPQPTSKQAEQRIIDKYIKNTRISD